MMPRESYLFFVTKLVLFGSLQASTFRVVLVVCLSMFVCGWVVLSQLFAKYSQSGTTTFCQFFPVIISPEP